MNWASLLFGVLKLYWTKRGRLKAKALRDKFAKELNMPTNEGGE